jgi:hypothetical protein
MASHLNIHLARNIARLKQTTFVCPDTGKTQTLGAVGGSLWLQVLLVICNTANDTDRLYYGGWRWLTKEAGTNNTGATYWVQVFEQIGWLTPNGTHAPDKGKKGKPCKCWIVTLPDLPPLLQEVWQMPEQARPQPIQAPVVAISERPKSTAKRLGAPATLTAQIGNLAKDLATAHTNGVHIAPEPQPAYSPQTLQVLDSAEACIRQQIVSQSDGVPPERQALRTTLVVEQAKGSWHARNGKRLPPVQQVENALRQGTCTDTEAVRYLASGQCNKADLLQFVGVHPTT